jgi:glycolate oxidase
LRKVTGGPGLAELSRDAGNVTIMPKSAYFAASEEEVAEALLEAQLDGLPITPRGGGTGIPTQSVGRGALILQTNSGAELRGGLVACKPAMVKSELNKVLTRHGKWVPVDPSSYESCTIGGMVANNSSGARTLKYGSTIKYVESVRVALLGGARVQPSAIPLEEALSSEQRTRRVASLIAENQDAISADSRAVSKNSSGYRLESALHDGLFDLAKLFVGSEGTLGIITEATLMTIERPSWRVLFVFETSLAGLDGAVESLRSLGPSALELVDKSVFRKVDRWEDVSAYSKSGEPFMLFCEMDGAVGDPSDAIHSVAESKAGALDPIAITGPADIQKAWDVRGKTLTLAQEIRSGARALLPGVEDLVVPPPRLGDLVKLLSDEFGRRGLDYIMYGHAGDANLHARPFVEPGEMPDLMEACFEEVWKMGGSITGEHGDGMLRAKYVERQYPKSYWIMREIKDILDPDGLMNPGVKII